ncbi:MAG: CRISPR-associated exonuclease Cas4 [Tepidanaerobacteraceae bacterium]|nr:CRISPR-associated exonuclease Cas4 [Tepidanaerobacteraceae bacterium]
MVGKVSFVDDQQYEELYTNGIKVNYVAVCPRKLWLYSRGMRMEPLSERVALGRLLHERSYEWIPRREVLIDNLIKVDVIEGEGRILEVKCSKKLSDAARLQVAYYLYYLKKIGAGELTGELLFPKERRREEIRLTDELEREVEEALKKIREIELLTVPPEAQYTSLCRLCAYIDLCWG